MARIVRCGRGVACLFLLVAFAAACSAAAAPAAACTPGDAEGGASTCAAGIDAERPACVQTNDGRCYDTVCRESLDEIVEVERLAAADPLAFVPRAWAWIEAAGKCVYAIDILKLPSLSAFSSPTLQTHIESLLRSALSADSAPLTPPAGACNKLIWKKKTLVKIFRATINGGIHPELKIKAPPPTPPPLLLDTHWHLFFALTLLAELPAQYDQLRRNAVGPSSMVEGGILVRRYRRGNCNFLCSRPLHHAQVGVQSICTMAVIAGARPRCYQPHAHRGACLG
jgi:hypothetical protein